MEIPPKHSPEHFDTDNTPKISHQTIRPGHITSENSIPDIPHPPAEHFLPWTISIRTSPSQFASLPAQLHGPWAACLLLRYGKAIYQFLFFTTFFVYAL